MPQPRPRRKRADPLPVPGTSRPAPTARPAGDAAVPVEPQAGLPLSLEWTHNPWRLYPLRSVAALAICLGVAYLAGTWMQSWLWVLIALALVGGSNSLLFLPARYRLDAKGVDVWFPPGVPNHRDWAHYRNAYFHSQLVHLTTMPRPSPLDPFRGHALLFDPLSPHGNHEIVRAFVEAHVRKA